MHFGFILRSLNLLMLGTTPKSSDFISIGCDLAIGILQSSPCDSNMQQSFGAGVLGYISLYLSLSLTSKKIPVKIFNALISSSFCFVYIQLAKVPSLDQSISCLFLYPCCCALLEEIMQLHVLMHWSTTKSLKDQQGPQMFLIVII